MTTPPQPPQSGTVSSADTGRPCPYCRFPLKEGIPMTRCSVCGAPHHGDCWADNGGCAVVACAGGPAGAAEAPTAASPAMPLPPPPPPPPTARHAAAPAHQHAAAAAPPPPPPPPPPHDPVRAHGAGSSVPWIALSVVAVVLIAAAAAVAVVVTRDDGGPSTQTVVTVHERPSAGGAGGDVSAQTVATPPARAATDDAVTVSDDEANRQQIEDLLYRHHEAIVEGDFHSAWELLSQRKQAQKLREDGYGGWVTAQSTLRPYLDPSGLHADIQELDPATGVARVMVTGMNWSKPGAACTQWSGITWVKHEDGEWRYDPGYSTTPEREQGWKSRYSELLGGACG
jgi:hypothetical protein